MTGATTTAASPIAALEDEAAALAAAPVSLSNGLARRFEKSLARGFRRYGETCTIIDREDDSKRAAIKIGVRTVREKEVAAGVPIAALALTIPALALRNHAFPLPLARGCRVIRFLAEAGREIDMMIDKDPHIVTINGRDMLYRAFAEG